MITPSEQSAAQAHPVAPSVAREALRAWAQDRVRNYQEVEWYDGASGYAIRAEPYPSKYDGAWQLWGNSASWYEPTERVMARVADATAVVWEP